MKLARKKFGQIIRGAKKLGFLAAALGLYIVAGSPICCGAALTGSSSFSMSSAPGDAFKYDSGNTHLLSAIITKLTRMSALEYAKAKLFGPLEINWTDLLNGNTAVSVGNYWLSCTLNWDASFGARKSC
jgi:CubicO group peptidase (beta-lactamase class C family)